MADLLEEALRLHSKLSTLYWQEYNRRDQRFNRRPDPELLERLDSLRSRAADRWRRRREKASG